MDNCHGISPNSKHLHTNQFNKMNQCSIYTNGQWKNTTSINTIQNIDLSVLYSKMPPLLPLSEAMDYAKNTSDTSSRIKKGKKRQTSNNHEVPEIGRHFFDYQQY